MYRSLSHDDLRPVKRTSRVTVYALTPFSEIIQMSSSTRSPSPGNEYMRPNQLRETSHTTKTDPSAPFVDCGHFLMRCVYPFVSVGKLIDVARDLIVPGSFDDTTEKVRERYTDYLEAVLTFSPALRMRTSRGDLEMEDIEKGIAKGLRASRSNDIYRLKLNTTKLIGKPGVELSADSKEDRGFNHDVLGRMLIPVQLIGAYDKDPVGVRAKARDGLEEEYQVTAEDMPSFLYEDPLKYDPENVLSGFMRGPFLIRCLRAIFLGPRMAMRGLGPDQKPSRACIAELYGVVSVTVPIMVYVAGLARFTLSSRPTWTGTDGSFDYEEFADLLFQVFQQDEDWTNETIQWWNKELFGHEKGKRVAGLARRNNPNGFLAKAKAQAVKRLAEKTVTERAPVEDPSPWDRAVTPASSLTHEPVEDHTDHPPSDYRSSPNDHVTPPDPGAGCGDGKGTTDKDNNITVSVRQKRKRGNDLDMDAGTSSKERLSQAKTAKQNTTGKKRRR
ncbi:hypothetical protein BJY52DRAFT_422297 [Lactarius psammicola]|nr:hypothetical protein BJY52DRAFT_422297 [Lactarius psammicola]